MNSLVTNLAFFAVLLIFFCSQNHKFSISINIKISCRFWDGKIVSSMSLEYFQNNSPWKMEIWRNNLCANLNLLIPQKTCKNYIQILPFRISESKIYHTVFFFFWTTYAQGYSRYLWRILFNTLKFLFYLELSNRWICILLIFFIYLFRTHSLLYCYNIVIVVWNIYFWKSYKTRKY